jgi:hypothetical protein
VQALVRAYHATGDVARSLTQDHGPSWAPITPSDVAQFWDVVVGAVVGPAALAAGFGAGGKGVRDRAQAALATHPHLRRRLETVYLALRALFLHRAELVVFGPSGEDPQQKVLRAQVVAVVPSVYHLALLCDHLMCRGRAVFEAALADLASQARGGTPVGGSASSSRGGGGDGASPGAGAGAVVLLPAESSVVWSVAREVNLGQDPSSGFFLYAAFYPDWLR